MILQFNGMALREDFPRYQRQFLNTMTNFRKLTDRDKLDRQPERIRIKTVTKSQSLSAALRSMGMPSDRLDELAILNGMELSQTVKQGTKLKVIGS